MYGCIRWQKFPSESWLIPETTVILLLHAAYTSTYSSGPRRSLFVNHILIAFSSSLWLHFLMMATKTFTMSSTAVGALRKSVVKRHVIINQAMLALRYLPTSTSMPHTGFRRSPVRKNPVPPLCVVCEPTVCTQRTLILEQERLAPGVKLFSVFNTIKFTR